MTRNEIRWDVRKILAKLKVTDDTRLDEDYLGYLVDQRRAKEIRDTFKRNPVIEPVWLQDLGAVQMTPVNKAEDVNIAFCDCKISKTFLPPVVSIVDSIPNTPDVGTYSIRSVCGKFEYHYINVQQLNLITKDSTLSLMRQYTKVGNALYLKPAIHQIRPILILESPLDGYVIDNTYILSGNLIIGIVYEVASGNITHGGSKKYKGETFTASSTAFTGPGKVQYLNQKRRMTNNDQYPMSHTMSEVIKLKILTQDFGVEQSKITDTMNDSSDENRGQ